MIDDEIRVLASGLGAHLHGAGLLCVTAESCTGGLLAGAITAVPGSSQWFDRGCVTYSNAAKTDLLQVSVHTLERHGAVSQETAIEMASGALLAVPNAQLALSTTGIAGPDGATAGKPVGMVCFGLARRMPAGIVTRADVRIFDGDRQAVRLAAVRHVLQWALDNVPA
ncbi:CinA family protein [Castellaniella sp.]|uniref:CinA family protein n=1 Tax=Castellaniella sp. TaxID=1955812 RepID=UPI003560C21E